MLLVKKSSKCLFVLLHTLKIHRCWFFSQNGCKYCEVQYPIFKKLFISDMKERQRSGRRTITFYARVLKQKKNESIIQKYSISGYPTLIQFQNAEEIKRAHTVCDLGLPIQNALYDSPRLNSCKSF